MNTTTSCWRCGGSVAEIVATGTVTVACGQRAAGSISRHPRTVLRFCACCGQVQGIRPGATDTIN